MNGDDIDALLRKCGPVEPASDLVDRIMAVVPAPESAIDRWNRVAAYFALAAGLAALVTWFELARTPDPPADPVATIAPSTDTELVHLLGVSKG